MGDDITAIRRLWHSAPGEPAGDVVELPVNEADRLIRRGEAIPVLPPVDEPPPGHQPLAALIRHLVNDDPEVRGLRITGRACVSSRTTPGRDPFRRRSAAAWQHQALGRINARLLPKVIKPAEFSRETLTAEFGCEPSGGWFAARPPGDVVDVIVCHLRRRGTERLSVLFDGLRHGQLVATGCPASNPILPVSIPHDLWNSAATMIEMSTGDMLRRRRHRDLATDAAVAGADPGEVSRRARS
jgi:hypothetical protein